MPDDTQKQIDQLRQQVEALSGEYYRNNFVSSQDFNKDVRFNSILQVPKYSALPTTCEIAQVGVYSGKLYVCSAANTWVVAGTQVA